MKTNKLKLSAFSVIILSLLIFSNLALASACASCPAGESCYCDNLTTTINYGGGGGGGLYTPTPTIKKGDANGDNKIDRYDFSLMIFNWGKTGTNTCDFNNDGKVDKYDFALLMLNWSI